MSQVPSNLDPTRTAALASREMTRGTSTSGSAVDQFLSSLLSNHHLADGSWQTNHLHLTLQTAFQTPEPVEPIRPPASEISSRIENDRNQEDDDSVERDRESTGDQRFSDVQRAADLEHRNRLYWRDLWAQRDAAPKLASNDLVETSPDELGLEPALRSEGLPVASFTRLYPATSEQRASDDSLTVGPQTGQSLGASQRVAGELSVAQQSIETDTVATAQQKSRISTAVLQANNIEPKRVVTEPARVSTSEPSPAETAIRNALELTSKSATNTSERESSVQVEFAPGTAVNATVSSERRGRGRSRDNRGLADRVGTPVGGNRAEPALATVKATEATTPTAKISSATTALADQVTVTAGDDLRIASMPMLPSGQRIWMQTGQGSTEGLMAAASPSVAGGETTAAFGNDSNPTLSTVTSGNTTAARDQAAMGSKTQAATPPSLPPGVPSRVLSQVANALRQVPAGDSTIRLQLNPVELGQLEIQISFRNGSMHGKLRAEQGQTVTLLQEGLEGLKTRLQEQGIVVQTLEVELGQQSDFAQQQNRQFANAEDYRQQRQQQGYFANGSRRSSSVDRAESTPPESAARQNQGAWAVNVVV